MKYTREEKIRVLNSGLSKQIKKVNKQIYLHSRERETGELYQHKTTTYEESIEALRLLSDNPDFDCACRINRSYKDKLRRLRQRLSFMLESGNCLFLTLTFTDFYIDFDYNVLRKFIRNFLNSLNCHYIANADWGDKNGRLHFHAIVMLDKIDYSSYKYGSINFKRIYNCVDSCNCLAHYMVKLTQHSLKNSTQLTNIMYSKHKFSFSDFGFIPLLPSEEAEVIKIFDCF